MKTILLLMSALLLFIPSLLQAAEVDGYSPGDGSYIQQYQRKGPETNPYKHYTFPENSEPSKGRIAPGNFDSYLRGEYQAIPKKEQVYKPLNPFVIRW